MEAECRPPWMAEHVRRFLLRAAGRMERHRRLLDRLDAALGDGDHGENMALGWAAVARLVDQDGQEDVGFLLRQVGHTLVAAVGGASGPLYGTLFIEAGFVLDGSRQLDGEGIARALEVGTRGLARRGRCSVGDKTILDALEPATRAFAGAIAAGNSVPAAARAAAVAAHQGMRATRPLVARRGLAMRLGERSRGHLDPGAVSCFLLVRSLLPSPGDGDVARPSPRQLAIRRR
jgi:dihydroxyacetone kinase-like protein